MKILLSKYVLVLPLLLAACQSPTESGLRSITDEDLAIEYATLGLLSQPDGASARHLRIAFDGYATYDERLESGQVNILRAGDLGTTGYVRLDSLFQARNFLSLTIVPPTAGCTVDGPVSAIGYRASRDTTMHYLTDAGCAEVPPAGFTILRYALAALIEDFLDEL